MFSKKFVSFQQCVFVALSFVTNLVSCEEYVKLNLNSKWEFQCPHVANVENYKKIVVTWSLNDAIWLKIDHGNATIINRLITFNRRQLGSSNVYTIVLNDFRYKYYYDEAIGDFSMTIQDTLREDSGLWKCKVDLHKNDGDIEELSAEAHILIGGAKPFTTPWYRIPIEHSTVTNHEHMELTSVDWHVMDEERSAGFNNSANVKFMKNDFSCFIGVFAFFVLF